MAVKLVHRSKTSTTAARVKSLWAAANLHSPLKFWRASIDGMKWRLLNPSSLIPTHPSSRFTLSFSPHPMPWLLCAFKSYSYYPHFCDIFGRREDACPFVLSFSLATDAWSCLLITSQGLPPNTHTSRSRGNQGAWMVPFPSLRRGVPSQAWRCSQWSKVGLFLWWTA